MITSESSRCFTESTTIRSSSHPKSKRCSWETLVLRGRGARAFRNISFSDTSLAAMRFMRGCSGCLPHMSPYGNTAGLACTATGARRWTKPRAADYNRRRRARGTLARSVRSQLMSEVPLGAFCSGGVDSGLVARMLLIRVRTVSRPLPWDSVTRPGTSGLRGGHGAAYRRRPPYGLRRARGVLRTASATRVVPRRTTESPEHHSAVSAQSLCTSVRHRSADGRRSR